MVIVINILLKFSMNFKKKKKVEKMLTFLAAFLID